MDARPVPTFAEIAAYRATLIKEQKRLSPDELDAMQDTLMRMEFHCLRAIKGLRHRSDSELQARASQRAQLRP